MVNGFDTATLKFFSELNTPAWLDALVLFWTDYSQQALIVFVLALFIFKKTRKSAAIGTIAMFLSPLLVETIWKKMFERVRPYDQFDWARLIGEPSDTFSFPSGHASFAFAISIALCFYSPKWAKALLIFSAFFTAFTRIYISIHYTTDVLAGAVNGTLCAVLAFYIVNGVQKLFRGMKGKKVE